MIQDIKTDQDRQDAIAEQQRFKKQLELAKKLCGPLRSGLEKYATQLENRK